MTPIHIRDTDSLQRLTTFLCLVPIVGVLPSLWQLWRNQHDRRELVICRQSLLLAGLWFLAYVSLNGGADIPGLPITASIRLLFLNSLITSGYFLTSLWLMARWWKGKSIRLPGLSQIAPYERET
jgi:hypothetical protein